MLDNDIAGLAAGAVDHPPAQAPSGVLAGTPVLTLRGAVAVEDLAVGDRVVTRAGALRLRAVETRVAHRARMVRIADSALGPDHPEQDILIAEGQGILVRDWRAKALANADRAMVPAVRLIDGDYIRAEARRDARFYALRFDVDAVVYACGLELACEAARVTV